MFLLMGIFDLIIFILVFDPSIKKYSRPGR